ncbi:hypothetical protein HYH03_003663 [Edaphochlamys debaryana]|uniref:DNA polymerase lambda fingers domain-containing protein n=1 Tax=Edaphochlamys debaryana TaxID=47281 RepID=A0A835YB09_9CHLO|nr:hypothetical protein HYH03_003663 [Edaphochlamys debaryana]|eukprot:KAG2498404.1 hypothetical protein HYH03_003663 [Edaphochlamys debaryana]
MVCYKNVVVAGLKALQNAERKSDAPTRGFKVRAYQTAIAAVAKMAGNLERPDQLDGLLTKTMERKARAMMEAAPMPVTPEAGGCDDVAGIEAAMELLKQVAGIGPVAARKLAVEHGVRTLEELRARQDELKLNQKQRLGLLHHVDINQRIPRTEMDAHAQILLQAAKKAGLGAEVVGAIDMSDYLPISASSVSTTSDADTVYVEVRLGTWLETGLHQYWLTFTYQPSTRYVALRVPIENVPNERRNKSVASPSIGAGCAYVTSYMILNGQEYVEFKFDLMTKTVITIGNVLTFYADNTGTFAKLYADNDYQGASLVVYDGSANIGSAWNDKLSSLRLPGRTKMEIYADENYGGQLLSLATGTTSYGWPSMGSYGFNDRMTSFKLFAI